MVTAGVIVGRPWLKAFVRWFKVITGVIAKSHYLGEISIVWFAITRFGLGNHWGNCQTARGLEHSSCGSRLLATANAGKMVESHCLRVIPVVWFGCTSWCIAVRLDIHWNNRWAFLVKAGMSAESFHPKVILAAGVIS